MTTKTRKRDVFFGILEAVGEGLAEAAEKDQERRALAREIVREQERRACVRQVGFFTLPAVEPVEDPLPLPPAGYKYVVRRDYRGRIIETRLQKLNSWDF